MFKRAFLTAITLVMGASPVMAQSSSGVFSYPTNAGITNPTSGTFNLNSTDLNLYGFDGSVWQRRTMGKLQLAGIGAPTASTDSTQGYSAGSFWYDTLGFNMYVCSNAAAGAAVWSPLTARVAATDIANAIQSKTTFADFCSDFLQSGALATTSASLSTTTGALVAYVTGLRQTTSSSTYTYPASSDTYDYLQNNGTWNHVAVANGASAPTGQTGLAIQKVVSSSSAITSVTQLASSYPVVSVNTATSGTNGAVSILQGDSRYCMSNGSHVANQFYGSPASGSGAVSLRNIAASDILFNVPVSRGGLGAAVTGGVGNLLSGTGSSSFNEITAPSAAGSYFLQNNGGSSASFWATFPILSTSLGGLGAATTGFTNGILVGTGGQYGQVAAPTVTGSSPVYNGTNITWQLPQAPQATFQQGRLGVVSGSPYADSGSTATNYTTIYFTPAVGNSITINGSTQPFSETSLALSTSASTAYYVYVTSASATTVSLGVTPWTNTTTPSTTYSKNGQIYADSGYTKLIVGGIYCPAANTVNNFLGARFVSNLNNEVEEPLRAYDSTTSWTTTSTTPVAANGSTVNGVGQCQVFSCIQREPVAVRNFSYMTNTGGGGTVSYIDIGVDGVSSAVGEYQNWTANSQGTASCSFSQSQQGLHTYARRNYVASSTGQFNGGTLGFLEGTCFQ